MFIWKSALQTVVYKRLQVRDFKQDFTHREQRELADPLVDYYYYISLTTSPLPELFD